MILGIVALAREAYISEEEATRKSIFQISQEEDYTVDYQYHDVGKVWITVSNWGFIGNPDKNSMPYYPSCMYPGGSDIDFLFRASPWFGAIVGDVTQPDTITVVGLDGWLASESEEMFPGNNPWDTLFVRDANTGMVRKDDDGDWGTNHNLENNPLAKKYGYDSDDFNHNGIADDNYDGLTYEYWLSRVPTDDPEKTAEEYAAEYANDDGDSLSGLPLYDEETLNGIDDDGDGLIDEDCGGNADANGDGDPTYDPENNIDEDPKGDPHYRGPGARLSDGNPNPNYDWTQPYDDDGDGTEDEDGVAVSEQDFIAKYKDVHNVTTKVYAPLGIEVTQKTYAWSYSYSDDYILVDYTIKNVGGLDPGQGGADLQGYYTLRECWLGIYVDGDVGPNWNTAYSGVAQDDYTGFNNQDRRMLGYIFDGPNNYEGHGDNAVWPGFLGVRIIDVKDTEGNNLNDLLNSDELHFSFNWWLSDSNNSYLDESPMVGPQIIDAPKYVRMSNLQDDYHAIANTTLSPTDPGYYTPMEGEDGFTPYNWPQPTEAQLIQLGVTDLPTSGYDIAGEQYAGNPNANSFHLVNDPGTEDTRFLVSYGPFTTIGPEDSLRIVIGIICGEYYDHLLQNAFWAKQIYDNNYVGPAPPPSPSLTVKAVGGGKVRLEWNTQSETAIDPISKEVEFEGYRVWRSRTEVQDDFVLLAEFDMLEVEENGEPFIGDTRYGLGLPGQFKDDDGLYKFYTEDYQGEREDYYGKHQGLECGAIGVDSNDDGIIDPNLKDEHGNPLERVTGYYYIDENVAELFTYYYSVTAYDRGVPEQGVEALDSAINNNMTYIRPSNPAGTVFDRDKGSVKSTLDDIRVVPNPYRGTEVYSSNEWGQWENAHSEYDRRMDFVNLPQGEVTIRIYTLAGDLVQTLGPIVFEEGEPGRITWDMLTRNRQRIVSGVYIYSVETDMGTKIGKFAVIR